MPYRRDIGTQPEGPREINSDTPSQPPTDSYADPLETDVLIVGAGFGGVYLLHRLRDELGFRCKIFEAGKELGGIWHWNCYPGARVDTQVPIYEYSMEKVWKDWTWREKYPGFQELREYFDHVDKTLDIKKDVAFDTRVVEAHFDKPSAKWVIKTEDGRTAYARYFLLATGFAAKRHFPDWPGLDSFKGEMHHSSFWPEEGVDLKGKRVAVIGTGSTGVQLAQESAKMAKSVTVFQRTPNLALPMRQRKLDHKEQMDAKGEYPQIFKDRMKTFAGFSYDFAEKNTFDDSPRSFWLATYKDMLFDMDANQEAYNFWLKKTRARISDPVKRDILAPLEKPHAFGVKRPSLEQDYYEMMDRPENEVVDVKATPIKEVKENGILTEDGKFREFDIIALATGFDSVTGGMKNMGLKDVDGVDLSKKWETGTWSYLGMSCSGYPNMFFLYGAQGPTAFSNGPSCVEVQGEWIVDAMKKLRDEGIKYIDPLRESEEYWRKNVTEISDKTLFPTANSWYMGANIPGKPREQLNYAGGIPLYEKECRESLNNSFKGFVTA
ncbi:hypothetical protein H2199_002928 [Coniosporium tulheliwenetii]|uniref:Uncharacterized protein n=1 Tax=Coniosporium tulheliwenetii TaxID=3383036 RepID=A0ACC2ZE64_9PEZI|nr:hypothetical protein H2199_002928 [Cladosporium sp. JES 115]